MKRIKSRFMFVFMVILSMILVLGCAQSSSHNNNSAAGEESDNQPATKKNKQLSVGTTNKSSGYYAYYGGLTKAVMEHAPHLQLTIIETGATNDNITRMAKGQVDFALGVMDGVYEAYAGISKWEDDPHPELRNLFTFAENAMFYVVREDSGVSKFADLEGKEFNAGIRGSTTEAQLKMVLGALGITPEFNAGSLDDAVNAVKDNHIVGLSKSGSRTTKDATLMDLELSGKLHLLGFTDEEVKKMKAEFPWITTTIIPKGIYDWQEEEVTTISQQIINFASSKLPMEVGYELTKAGFEGKKHQEEAYKAISTMDYMELTLKSPIPLHAGTVKYLKEQGVDVPEELIPPEYEEVK